MKTLDVIVFGCLAAALAAVAVLLFSAPEGGEDWDAFVRDRHCQTVGGADGSNRAGWRCDDGRIYYRWRQQR
jgi:hypothetical protein